MVHYQNLEDAGEFRLEISGGLLDVYLFGVLQINLHDIANKTALWLLSEEGLIEPTWRRPKWLPAKYPIQHRNIIRAEIKEIKAGSVIESIGFAAAIVLANPDARAILQNLGATIIWAISVSGVRGIISRKDKPPIDVHPPLLKRKDPLEIGSNLTEVLLAALESRSGDPLEITFTHKSSRQERSEVVIKIDDKGF